MEEIEFFVFNINSWTHMPKEKKKRKKKQGIARVCLVFVFKNWLFFLINENQMYLEIRREKLFFSFFFACLLPLKCVFKICLAIYVLFLGYLLSQLITSKLIKLQWRLVTKKLSTLEVCQEVWPLKTNLPIFSETNLN